MPKNKFELLLHHEIDKAKWDHCIAQSSNLIYPNSWYLDCVAPNWKAIIYNDYEAIFPITWRKKYFIKYLFQPFFTQQLGLFCIQKKAYSKLYIEFLSFIKSNFKHINIQLNEHFTERFPLKNNYILSLDERIENLQKKYSTQTKRNLKKAKKYNLIIETNIDVKEPINLFKNNKGGEVNELKSKDYNNLVKLCSIVENKAKIESLCVFSEKKIVAGAVFFMFKNRITLILLASDKEGKEKGASTLLINYIISKYSNSNYILDFEGSQIKTLAQFYKGFGSKNQTFATFKHSFIPFSK